MFTLVMLVFIEAIGVSQRINNMQRLRDMAGDACKVHVFRSNSWREIDSSALLPGDVVRVAIGTVPADILLMSGSCVVNEAILTGESVPQSKFPPAAELRDALQPLLPEHRPYILFCGSSIVQLQQGDRTARGKMCGM